MLTAAVVIDDWKLPVFKQLLKENEYTYTEHKGMTKGTLTLRVKTESISKLQPVIQQANDKAAKNKTKLKLRRKR